MSLLIARLLFIYLRTSILFPLLISYLQPYMTFSFHSMTVKSMKHHKLEESLVSQFGGKIRGLDRGQCQDLVSAGHV